MALFKTKTLCLQQLVDAVGPAQGDSRALGSLLGLHSVRVAGGAPGAVAPEAHWERQETPHQYILTPSASIFGEQSVTLASASDAKRVPLCFFFRRMGFSLQCRPNPSTAINEAMSIHPIG